MVIFHSYVSLPEGTRYMGMDQYLLIPFLVGWTSINPSYFDVNYRGTRFWPTAISQNAHILTPLESTLRRDVCRRAYWPGKLWDGVPEMLCLVKLGEYLPSGKHTKNYGKSPFSMGKSTISMVIFNSYVKLPEGTSRPVFLKLYLGIVLVC